MSYTAVLLGNNKFSPQFRPAVLSKLSPYITVTTGLPTGPQYQFRGTRFTTVDADNYIDRFLLMEKGNQEMRAMYLAMENGQSYYFYTPNGGYLRFYKRVQEPYIHSIIVYANDGSGEINLSSPDMTNAWSHWISFQIDLVNEKAVCMDWTLQNSDPEYGQAFFSPGNSLTEEQKGKLYNVLLDVIVKPDPYESGGTSTSGGGGGSFDDTSDAITVPSVPALNLSLNHFISAYVPTLTELNNLADFVWGQYDKTDASKLLSKVFSDPIDGIISLHMLPFTPGSSTAIEVTIGRYGSSINMKPMTAQFTDVDCGSLTLAEYWGNYLDYAATRITLFLPYVGEVDLNPDEVMGQTLSVLYRVDNLTGAFVCFLSITDKILAQYNGCCALSVPISSADYRQLNSAILGAAMVAVGAAGVAAAAGAGLAAGASEGNIGSLNLSAGGVSSALNVSQSKVHHSHSGALGGAAGFLGSQKPYVIIHRARQCLPEGLNVRAGYPSMVTMKLGDCYGFTSVSSIILSGLPFTDGELSELVGILKEGFIA